MGREGGGNPTAVHSSIALLQERFRQLQRVREMREERELLRVSSEPAERPTLGAHAPHHRPNSSLHPHLLHPSRPPHAPNHPPPESTATHHPGFPPTGISSPSTGLWSIIPNASDDMDVDTSLHL